jgi:membrane fusion protein (multidrug efflux system)
VEVTEGSRVTSGAKLAAITDPDKLKISIEVAVSDLSAIKRGMPGELRLTDGTDPIPVKVLGLSPYVDSATGTATAELTFGDKQKASQLTPGLVGVVSFKAREHQGLKVPDAAILYRGQDSFLRVVHDGKAKFVPVALGETRSGEVEVLKGLSTGDSVIIRSSSYVGNGEAVNAQTLGTGEGGNTAAE